jgi:hypothetical protein
VFKYKPKTRYRKKRPSPVHHAAGHYRDHRRRAGSRERWRIKGRR